MTFAIGHVQGGTDAGWRVTKSAQKEDWQCPSCTRENKSYWVNCPSCSEPRPA